MSRNQLLFAASAIPEVGGQGLNFFHMAQGFSGLVDVTTFALGTIDGLPGNQIERSALATTMGRVPVIRRCHGRIDLAEARSFDRRTAKEVHGQYDFFAGASSQCLKSLDRASSLGCRTILDCVTLHGRTFRERQIKESVRFGISPRLLDATVQRMEAEYARADRIRVMSSLAKADLVSRGVCGDKITVATPPVDCSQFPRANFQEDIFRISFVGMLEPTKGIAYLLDAFDRLSPDNNVELVFWGGFGSRRVAKFFQSYLDSHPGIIIRSGSIWDHGLHEVYAKSSVLVHPSLADGFGYVVQEAMACGLPVIVTDATGAADLVTDGRNGFVVPAGDAQSIADRLAHLIQCPGLLPTLGRRALDTVKNTNMQAFTESLANLIK
jgi:glycosyltransferase involved in cell wall biosynthesis